MASTIFLVCLILTNIFITLYIKMILDILQYKVWSNKLTENDTTPIKECLFLVALILYIFTLLMLLYLMIRHSLYYYFVRLIYWKCYVPILIYFILLFSIFLYIFCSKQYKTSKQAKYISKKIESVLCSIQSFEHEIKDIDDDNHLSATERKNLINELNETITLLRQIYAELYRSFDILLVNESIDNIKNVEVSESNIVNLERKIHEFEAYRSLSDVSMELDNLVKKYTK